MGDVVAVTAAELPAAVRETHSAVLFLIGDRAYKVKKAVDLGFLDFSTPERREQACRRELALNRRLAPDVYLGVAVVTDPAGRPCEHLLVMRRMPETARLTQLVEQGVDVSDALRHLARDVAAFHATARTGPEISRSGSPVALESRWRDNITTLNRLRPGAAVRRAGRYAYDYIAGRHRLLEARMAAGLVRDGHGDLLADDVFCLPEGPRALDCLDFDDRLRWMDVIDDVACLAMDLEHKGAPAAAHQFLRYYAEFSGKPHPESLQHHYVAYRAVMRAKVAAIRQAQRPEAGAALDREVTSLLRLAISHLRRGEVRLLVVGGAPATGKTTLAEALAERTRFAVLSSDRIRKEMLGFDPAQHLPAAHGGGIYTAEVTERAYRLLGERTETLLSMGESVIVDASFATREHRRLFQRLAARTSSALAQLQCRTPPPVTRERLRRRESSPDAYSDALESVGERLAAEREPWPEAAVIDTSMPVTSCLEQALRAARLA